jgi:hypothetical protein
MADEVARWRAEMLADLDSTDAARATDALLALTYDDPDGNSLEGLLLRIIDSDRDDQLRALAVICLGHTARIRGAITRQEVMPVLRRLVDDPVLGGSAQDAIDDIDLFTRS